MIVFGTKVILILRTKPIRFHGKSVVTAALKSYNARKIKKLRPKVTDFYPELKR
jgi:hypothetical protein